MISLPLHTTSDGDALLQPTQKPQPAYRLRNRWSHGRGYVVIALLAPLVLSNLVLFCLHGLLSQQLTKGQLSQRQ